LYDKPISVGSSYCGTKHGLNFHITACDVAAGSKLATATKWYDQIRS